MVLAITDSNDCDFAIRFPDVSLKDMVRGCMLIGLEAWYAAAHPETWERNEWDKEEVESFYGLGYAEPTMKLLDRHGIDYECFGIEFDEDENVVDEDGKVVNVDDYV